MFGCSYCFLDASVQEDNWTVSFPTWLNDWANINDEAESWMENWPKSAYNKKAVKIVFLNMLFDWQVICSYDWVSSILLLRLCPFVFLRLDFSESLQKQFVYKIRALKTKTLLAISVDEVTKESTVGKMSMGCWHRGNRVMDICEIYKPYSAQQFLKSTRSVYQRVW